MSDGFVECQECGHRIEDHRLKGCETPGCTSCKERWTVQEIMRVRRREGLPGEWRR